MKHRLTEDEKAERARQDEIYLRARQEKQRQVEDHAFEQFFYAHRSDGIYLQANEQILRKHLKQVGLPVTLDNIERAYEVQRENLAYQDREYVRQTQPRTPLAQRRPGPASKPKPVVLQYSADEIRAMEPDELRKLMRRPEYLEEINRILAVKVS